MRTKVEAAGVTPPAATKISFLADGTDNVVLSYSKETLTIVLDALTRYILSGTGAALCRSSN